MVSHKQNCQNSSDEKCNLSSFFFYSIQTFFLINSLMIMESWTIKIFMHHFDWTNALRIPDGMPTRLVINIIFKNDFFASVIHEQHNSVYD